MFYFLIPEKKISPPLLVIFTRIATVIISMEFQLYGSGVNCRLVTEHAV